MFISFTLKLQTWMSLFILLNTKDNILKNVGNQTVDGSQWLPSTVWLHTCFKMSPFVFHWERKAQLSVWSDIRESEWWQMYIFRSYLFSVMWEASSASLQELMAMATIPVSMVTANFWMVDLASGIWVVLYYIRNSACKNEVSVSYCFCRGIYHHFTNLRTQEVLKALYVLALKILFGK